MRWGKHKDKPAFRRGGKIVFHFFGLMGGVIITNNLNYITFRVSFVQFLQKADEVRTLVCFAYYRTHLTCKQINSCKKG